eukprot:NODE_193_length_1230_cov_472.244787_g189_i0.p1 GENE.NODE_193_length_1230_cov_472.244787_g189_i0~~NODE_193_length_1230_cov_472.244787_g189_i0.p1  ORF type:complete len:313 (+),score=54.56 NODE_193_length_1230_cov_472.244787_g189_i0:67-939(+)
MYNEGSPLYEQPPSPGDRDRLLTNYYYGTPSAQEHPFSSPMKQKVRNTPRCVIHFFVLFVTGLLLVGSIAVLVIFQTQKNKGILSFTGGAYNIVKYTIWGVCGGIALFALLGIASVLGRSGCGLFIYASFLLLIFLCVVSFAIGIYVISGKINAGSKWKSELDSAWQKMITHNHEDPMGHSLPCQIQKNFHCSGFDKQGSNPGCCWPGKCYSTDAPPSWVDKYCPVCHTFPQDNYYTTSCFVHLTKWLSDHFVVLAIIGFGSSSVVLLTFILCCYLMCASEPRRSYPQIS